MQSDKQHPTRLTTTEPSVELGREIMRLRYDLAWNVLIGMVQEAQRQSVEDSRRGRYRLASALRRIAHDLTGASMTMSEITNLCRKYIDQEKEHARQSEGGQAEMDYRTGGQLPGMAPRAHHSTVSEGSSSDQGAGTGP